jgi:hypothetical protein
LRSHGEAGERDGEHQQNGPDLLHEMILLFDLKFTLE